MKFLTGSRARQISRNARTLSELVTPRAKSIQHIPRGQGSAQLTGRQLEIADLVVMGYTNQQISQRLRIGFETARTHLRNIRCKLQVNTRLQIAVWRLSREK